MLRPHTSLSQGCCEEKMSFMQSDLVVMVNILSEKGKMEASGLTVTQTLLGILLTCPLIQTCTRSQLTGQAGI
jgi:hypothetical protein